MIRLDRVELLHWDMQPHQELTLARGITLMTGENGSGKTSVLDAIKVGLGAKLEGDRSARAYLLKAAAPVAMIRILVDNRPQPGTRRRPFDPLGEHAQDTVTLAVVFRAADEEDYNTEYYILDGDVVPIAAGRRKGDAPRPLASREAYRERLQKVGIGRQYLKLLCLKQGDIASLCAKKGGPLFDDLYDVIGGREVLVQWQERQRDLNEQTRRLEATATEVKDAEERLFRLADRARRYERFVAERARADALRLAVPHARRSAAEGAVRRLAAEGEGASADIRRLDGEIARDATEVAALNEQIRLVTAAIEEAERGLDSRRQDERRLLGALSELKGRLGTLDAIRRAGEGVAPADVPALEEQAAELAASVAEGDAAAKARAARRARLEQDLRSVRQGLLPYPEEVGRLRAALRAEGIPHHLLAEVLEVRDPAWAEAIEGYLGRWRLAVLVQDPASWPRAAALARALRYPHGVLAPDVRGSSPADAEGLLARLDVREPRYRPLLARLLRPVQPGPLSDPLEPPRAGERLDQDGFALSRVEARQTVAAGRWLGRDALEAQRLKLELDLATLASEEEGWRARRGTLQSELKLVHAALAAQARRLAWEEARDEHSQKQAALARLEAELDAIGAEIEAARRAQDDRRKAQGPLQKALGATQTRLEQTTKRRAERAQAAVALAQDLEAAERELSQLLAGELPPPTDEVQQILAGAPSPGTLQKQLEEVERALGAFAPEDRDPMLPVNARRQQEVLDTVRQSLARTAAQVAETQVTVDRAREQYQETTRRVFRAYFARLREAGQALDFQVDGRLEPREDGRFEVDIRVRVGDKPAVHHDSQDLSGGQKAALSILMGMTAVSLESDGAGFFLIDEPFAASDVNKINELGSFLARTEAQYLLSMPTSSDLEQCGSWLGAVWTTTRTRGGVDTRGRPVPAPPIKQGFLRGARDG